MTGYAAPAGGGRIALALTNAAASFTSFTGGIMAYCSQKSGALNASAGTIYRETAAHAPGKGELVVNNFGGAWGYGAYNTDLNAIEAVTYEFSRIVLTNNAQLNIGSDDTLIVTNTELVGNGSPNHGIWISGGTLAAPADFSFTRMFIAVSATGATFSPATSLTVGDKAEFRVDKPHAMACDITVAPGGNLTHTPNPGSQTENYKLDLSLQGKILVQSGGAIDVSGRGFPANYGPGSHPFNTSGASHGGLGVGSLDCYGSIAAPVNLGSGGRSGGAGGGAIIMAVSGTVSNEGVISANAAMVTQRTGAGGSINIIAGSIAGNGVISANSATNVTSDSPGGGGRISLAVTNAGADFSEYFGVITAYGGRKPGSTCGGAGTVYLREAGQGLYEGTLFVDNDNMLGLGTEISSNVLDATVGNVFIRNGGLLRINTNQTLTLSGDWHNNASFTGLTDSAVIFDGPPASTSSVYGFTTFSGFLCTNGLGKTIRFQAGTMSSIAAGGRLLLAGAPSSTNLVLRSTVDGNAWRLTLDPLAAQAVSCVDVKDSDALSGGGAEVIAINSRDSGANFNWKFLTIYPGMEITWTGASSTLFSLRSNWDLDRAPLETDVIVIPGGCDNYPALDAEKIVHALDIQSGATLALNGWNLVVTNMLTVAGKLTATDTESLTLLKDADFTGGMFDAFRSTLVLAGGDAQDINLGGATFYRLRVENSTAPITFSGGFTATELRCEAPDGTRTLVFEPGKVVRLRDIVLLGSTTSPNIALRSSSPGGGWGLAVSGYRSASGVDVQDSHAGVGLPITATFSTDSGNNVNWVFGAEWSEWLGTINTDFHTAGNWSSGIVPDSKTRVRVESANPMVISWPATVLDMTVGGGADKPVVTANAGLTVTEDITILTNGTLALNKPSLIRGGLYVMGGGTLTHSANDALETNKLELAVYGDVGVDEGGIVNVLGKGYAVGRGPGSDGGGQGRAGASHGGRGVPYAGRTPPPTYGSFIAPTNLGSGGGYSAGGGAIIIAARGTIRLDGLLIADGAEATHYQGTGGSVFLTAGAIRGIGKITANGGDMTQSEAAAGGGRISLVVTNMGADFAAFTGELEARSTVQLPARSDARGAGAGTIHLKRWADRPGRGTVFIDNKNKDNSGLTDVPPYTNYVTGEVDFAPFRVSNRATLRLTNDFMVGDIWLDTANSILNLNSRTLTVRSREHPLGSGTVQNYGEIIWLPYVPKGTMYFAK